LSSLIKLSGGKTSGVVLAGYDAAFADNAYYQSHLDSAGITPISMEAIAQAATLTARAALAYAYNGNNGDDDGNNNGDDGIDYASNQIADLDSDDETLVQLADCLFSDGKCNLLKDYSKMDRVNSREETSRDAGSGAELGTPPNFYVSVFDHRNGQAFAIINDNVYGAYSSDDSQYGVNENDVVLIRPSVLEAGIRGLLNDFLGRGSVDDTDSNDFELTSCQSSADCTDVSYCSSSGDAAVCTGGKSCVCSRSHFHVALDEAIVPLANNFTGFFDVSDDDEGVSPMYSEPYWSNDIGVSVYRDGMESGSLISGLGVVVTAASVVATIFLKKRLHKEKLY
jgi:nicastrin